MPACLVPSTCATPEDATRIADAPIDGRLAACVTALPGAVSTYRWRGVVRRDGAVQRLIETRRERTGALIARLQPLQTDELPEVIPVDITSGLPAYLQWLAAEPSPDGDPT